MISKREQKAQRAKQYYIMAVQRGDWFAGFGRYDAEGLGELRVPFWTWTKDGAIGYPGIKSARRVLGTLVGEIKAGRMDSAGRLVIVNHRGEVVA